MIDLDCKIELCLFSVWKNSWRFQIKLAWIHSWERVKKRLDFGDLDLIFKVTYTIRMSYFD